MKKRLYLYRLMVGILILLLPVMFFCILFWNRSFGELEKNNDNYYENILEAFADDINDKVSELKVHAADVVGHTKDSKSAFWLGNIKFMENKYYYLEAVWELREKYTLQNISSWGIYYYGQDRIITTDSVLTLEQYFHKNRKYISENSPVWSVFDEKAYKKQEWMFVATNPEQAKESSMLIGFCTNVGKMQDKVLIFYVIDSIDFSKAIEAVYGNSGINFYVLEQNTDTVYMALGNQIEEDVNLTEVHRDDAWGFKEQKIVYRKNDSHLPLSYALHITENFFQSGIMSFYYEMRSILIVTIIMVVCAFGLALYLTYKPVHGLTNELEYDSGDEFLAIRNILESKSVRITEQEMMIMDLLLNNLVQGRPVSQSKLTKLGIAQKYHYYCVMVLEGDVLLSDDVEQITCEMDKRFSGRLFVTDWENENILILFMKDDNIDMVTNGLKEWLLQKNVNYTLRIGNITNNLNEIRASYLSCYREKEEKLVQNEVMSSNYQEERQQKIKKDILTYLEIHYRDADLTQTQVADFFQISHYTLSRMFKNLVGVGFSEYVNAKRIELAKELLLTSEYSIREVSLMVGFDSVNYFSRLFKNSTGVTPTDFRKQS